MTNSVFKNKSSVSFMKHRAWVVNLRTQINISLQEAQRNLVQNGTVVARPHRPRAHKSNETYCDSCTTLILRCIYFCVFLHSCRYWYRLLHEIQDSHKTCISCATQEEQTCCQPCLLQPQLALLSHPGAREPCVPLWALQQQTCSWS